MIKCIEYGHKEFVKLNGSPNRYYCGHDDILERREGSKMICICERNSDELTIKTSPRWCPLKLKIDNEI